ncbi:hypothetical protein IQ238_28955 [Pleurocapsales cyanobacterium LEGE 06147]|nr:hypothetical protein [Pleurocapsales cyanobacterium LEGE 06147]
MDLRQQYVLVVAEYRFGQIHVGRDDMKWMMALRILIVLSMIEQTITASGYKQPGEIQSLL